MRQSPQPFGLVPVARGEAVPALLAAMYFFFVLCSYSMLRPLRDAIGLARSPEALSNLFLFTLFVTLACNPLLSALMSRFSRRTFIPLTYHIFAASLVGFFVLMRFFHEHVGEPSGRVFFVWLTVYQVFATTLFWAFMVDVFTLDQGKRLFAPIGVGGTLGAVCGAKVSQHLATQIDPAYLMLAAAVALQAAILCFKALARRMIDRPAPESDPMAALPAPVAAGFVRDVPGGVWSGIGDALRSPYLLGSCVYIAMIGVAGTFLYFEQARIVKAAAISTGDRTAMLARIDFLSQSATLLVQVLVASHVIRWLGVGVTLVLLPLVTGAVFFALGSDPTLQTLVAAQVLSRSAQHALARPARETLFTVVSRGNKYRAKSFIDTFMFRAGDVIGTLADRGAAAAGIGLAVLAIPIAVGWGAVGIALGIGQGRRARRSVLHAAQRMPTQETI